MENSYSNNIVLGGGVVDLDRFVDSAVFTIERDTCVNAINLHNNMNWKFIVKEGKALTINLFDYAVALGVKFDIELYDNSKLFLNGAFISEQKYEIDITTKLYGDNINADVRFRGVNETQGIVRVSMEGVVAGETKGNVLNEYIKVINKSKLSNVLIPNLIVNSNEVEANHGASISKISEEEKFYLLSKGIDAHHAEKMIEEGFLLSVIDDEEIREKIKNILVGR